MTAYASLGLQKLVRLTFSPLTISTKAQTFSLMVITLAVGLALALAPLSLGALLVSGLSFFILALIYPVLYLYLLILIIPISSLLAIEVGGIRIGLMEVVLALGLFTWLLKLLAEPARSGQNLRIVAGPLAGPFLLLLSGVSLSWLTALSIGASVVETIKWVEMLALYLSVINLLKPHQIKWVVMMILTAGLIQAGLGLYQFIFKVGPDGFLLFDGRFLRAYGTFAQPNPYGGYLGLVLPLTLSLTIWLLTQNLPPLRYNRQSKLSRLLNLILVGLPLAIMVAALLASQSRGALLGFAVAGVVTLMVWSRKFALAVAGLALVGVMVGLISSFNLTFTPPVNAGDTDSPYNAIVQRVADAIEAINVTDVAHTEVTDANFATLERLAHWQAAQAMWRDHLWLGVGIGNYAVVYPAYTVGRWLDPLGHAHNYLLNIGAEAGLVGITVYLIFWILTFGLLWTVVQNNRDFYQAVAAGAVGIVTHLHVHNLVDNLYVQGMYLHVAVILGLASVIYLSNHQDPISRKV
ncbi:MAG: O-antigen ligase family protein [Anaerolineaceae bacterium]|nr:O-antigen ligase family protein [Anaerolineaceae bacterium]MCB9099051.1 O-antigen ligase family protein [Anaerolineales bacterium]